MEIEDTRINPGMRYLSSVVNERPSDKKVDALTVRQIINGMVFTLLDVMEEVSKVPMNNSMLAFEEVYRILISNPRRGMYVGLWFVLFGVVIMMMSPF